MVSQMFGDAKQKCISTETTAALNFQRINRRQQSIESLYSRRQKIMFRSIHFYVDLLSNNDFIQTNNLNRTILSWFEYKEHIIRMGHCCLLFICIYWCKSGAVDKFNWCNHLKRPWILNTHEFVSILSFTGGL